MNFINDKSNTVLGDKSLEKKFNAKILEQYLNKKRLGEDAKNTRGLLSLFEKAGILRPFLNILIWILDSAQVIVIALTVFAVTHIFIFSPHTVDGTSMEPTFCTGDIVIADKITPRFNGYHRGDVIIFEKSKNEDYIKRIIGIGGDTVLIRSGEVFINGELLREPYLGNVPTDILPASVIQDGVPFEIPPGHFFVLGDNRPHSSDSRVFGDIDPEKNTIKGRVVFVVWPPQRFGFFNKEEYKFKSCKLN